MTSPIPLDPIQAAAERAAWAIPPVWPLASSVAVNPFLGQTGESLAEVSARLARVAGAKATMPRRWYLARIDGGQVRAADLEQAQSAVNASLAPHLRFRGNLADAARLPERPEQAVPTAADLAARVSGVDLPGLITERLGGWMAGYFDEGQALWASPRGRGAYAAWRAVATHDLTPEIMGLSGFARLVSETPDRAPEAVALVAQCVGVSEAALDTWFHQMLLSLGGWAQVARWKLWQAELAGGTDTTLTDLLAIRLVWELALFERYEDQIADAWAKSVALHAAPVRPGPDQVIDAMLQRAVEYAAQRTLADTLAAPATGALAADDVLPMHPALQAVFCIDVRSEVFRRGLESLSPDIETRGFAGFFGVAVQHRRFASDTPEHRLPVLLNPGLFSTSGGGVSDGAARVAARASRAWGRFRTAAVSSFAFVEATGPLYAAKLLRDALGFGHAAAPDAGAPRLDPELGLEARVAAAANVLRAMSLTSGFARLVLLVGHGASVVNNPHASGLHCGACGGYSGEVNARLLAGLLNAVEVREGLAAQGVQIPADTLFVGALHDTTTDAVTLFADDTPAPAHQPDLMITRDWLAQAGRLARTERALRLPGAKSEASLAGRSRNWAEVRPEWALAGCRAFIAAPRRRTAGRSLKGQAFLHDYDWKADADFSVLELILTAPVVVASWISLQYYGSTVAPDLFGGGDKLLHNVTGGMGVVEGNGGLLRAGLSWQSVHDGEDFVHEPLRLSVCIEAPRAAIAQVLSRHDSVRALFDNGWLHLFALDETGAMAWRYLPNPAGEGLNWERLSMAAAAPEQALAG